MERAAVAALDHCYVTTTGRRTGRPHTIEIWFALEDERVFVLSGGGDRSDWVRNIREHPTVGLRLGDADYLAHAAILDPTDAADERARRLLVEKYASRTDDDLTTWQREALVVAIDLPAA